jgi:hypothetical protein
VKTCTFGWPRSSSPFRRYVPERVIRPFSPTHSSAASQSNIIAQTSACPKMPCGHAELMAGQKRPQTGKLHQARGYHG